VTDKRPRGRPTEEFDLALMPDLLHLLMRTPASFEEACKRLGTSRYLVRRAMAGCARIEYDIRLACLRSAYRRRLPDAGGRPEVIEQAAYEAHRLSLRKPEREWEEVQADMLRMEAERAAVRGAMIDTPIPEARDATEEAF
jgi:hypothetical protein